MKASRRARKAARTTALPPVPRSTPSQISASLTGPCASRRTVAESRVQTSIRKRWSRSQTTSSPSCHPRLATTACSLNWTNRSGQSWWRSWTSLWTTKTSRRSSTMALRTAKTLWNWQPLRLVVVLSGEGQEGGDSLPRVYFLQIWWAWRRSFPHPLPSSSRILAPAPPKSDPRLPGLLLLIPLAPLSPPPLPLPQLFPPPSLLLPGKSSLHPTTSSLRGPKTCPLPSSSRNWLSGSRESSTSTDICSSSSQEPSSPTTPTIPLHGPRCPIPLKAHKRVHLVWTNPQVTPFTHRISIPMPRSSWWYPVSPTRPLQRRVPAASCRAPPDTPTCWVTRLQGRLSATPRQQVLRPRPSCWTTTTPNLCRTMRRGPDHRDPLTRTRRWACFHSSSSSAAKRSPTGLICHTHRWEAPTRHSHHTWSELDLEPTLTEKLKSLPYSSLE